MFNMEAQKHACFHEHVKFLFSGYSYPPLYSGSNPIRGQSVATPATLSCGRLTLARCSLLTRAPMMLSPSLGSPTFMALCVREEAVSVVNRPFTIMM